jgi:hypothetical protein
MQVLCHSVFDIDNTEQLQENRDYMQEKKKELVLLYGSKGMDFETTTQRSIHLSSEECRTK